MLLSSDGVKARTIKHPYDAAYMIGLATELGCLFSGRPALANRQKVREAAQRYWLCDVGRIENDLRFRAGYPLRKGLNLHDCGTEKTDGCRDVSGSDEGY